jgi:hypothetical protein
MTVTRAVTLRWLRAYQNLGLAICADGFKHRTFGLTVVGVAGFEPTTSSSRTKRATKLRHTPVRPPRGSRNRASIAELAHRPEIGARDEGQQRGFGSAGDAHGRERAGAEPGAHVEPHAPVPLV